jgi:large subunit ribosomal protein L30e
MDLQKAIRIAVETGKTIMGSRQGKVFALKGGAAILLISKNCLKQVKEEIMHDADRSKTPYYEADLTSMEIGSVCGKPFPVSILSIIEPGNSDILKVLEKGTMIDSESAAGKETVASMKKRRNEKKGKEEKKKEEKAEGEESEMSDSESEEETEGESAEAE